jgi:hypothetical protein
MRIPRNPALLAATLLATGALAATAFAATFASSDGGAQVQIANRSESHQTWLSSTAWVDLPGAEATLTVPNGQTRLFNARFTAESICAGTVMGQCNARIVASGPGGVVELDPANADYAFDSVGVSAAVTDNNGDRMEGNAMERSKRLGAGSWSIRVQRAVSDPRLTFTLDDWHLAVEMSV